MVLPGSSSNRDTLFGAFKLPCSPWRRLQAWADRGAVSAYPGTFYRAVGPFGTAAVDPVVGIRTTVERRAKVVGLQLPG
jgi:hypothetical protein